MRALDTQEKLFTASFSPLLAPIPPHQHSSPHRNPAPLPTASAPFTAFPTLAKAITLLLLPFVGIGLFLLRRNFQRGGMSRNLVAQLAQKMAGRGGPHGGGGGLGGPMMGEGGGAPWTQRAPTEGALSSLFARMLGGGIRGMQLVGVLRRCVREDIGCARVPARFFCFLASTALPPADHCKGVIQSQCGRRLEGMLLKAMIDLCVCRWWPRARSPAVRLRIRSRGNTPP